MHAKMAFRKGGTFQVLARLVSLEKKFSIAFNQDPDVGVKWKTQCGWSANHAKTAGCLCVA